MPGTPQSFRVRVDRLTADLVEQARRVQSLLELSIEALFARDASLADQVAARDDVIDQADVALERASVQLLTDAVSEHAHLDADSLRWVLTIVKVNNELERVADAAVDLAELVAPLSGIPAKFPDTFRVMANSVIGILRDAGACIRQRDPALAKVVLQSQHTVSQFKTAILRDAERAIAAGAMSVDFAFLLHEIGSLCEVVADHCTNLAEQVIYAVSGTIVRHEASAWVEVPPPSKP